MGKQRGVKAFDVGVLPRQPALQPQRSVMQRAHDVPRLARQQPRLEANKRHRMCGIYHRAGRCAGFGKQPRGDVQGDNRRGMAVRAFDERRRAFARRLLQPRAKQAINDKINVIRPGNIVTRSPAPTARRATT